MRFFAALCVAFLFAAAEARGAADAYRQLTTVDKLPVALDRDFQIRKAKVFILGETPVIKAKRASVVAGGPVRDPAVGFESSYRLFGAVTGLDQRSRAGHYYDFFWRSKKRAAVTIRLEYQQEKLRTLTQAREVTYPEAKGSHRTEFTIIGDDYYNDGRVLAWRCLLVANGRIVAEHRSFLWR